MTRLNVHWKSVPAGDALALYSAAEEEERFLWECPARGVAVVGLGRTRAIECAGEGRFADTRDAIRALSGQVDATGPAPVGGGALLVGGFAFEPGRNHSGFPDARFVLPRITLLVRPEGAWLGVAGADAVSEADRVAARLAGLAGVPTPIERAVPRFQLRADGPHAAFRGRVQSATNEIRRGRLEKVVVARACDLESSTPIRTEAVLARLRAAHPTCTTFAVSRGEHAFLGATPERLVRLDGDRVEADAVAGSAPRGLTPDGDRRLARGLRESKKEQEEHAVVARAMYAALAPACRDLLRPESPSVLKTAGIQHLHTPFSARLLDPSTHLLDLAERLHPTPAVGGAPTPEALAWLRSNEPLVRGWYAAPLGVVELDGSGELSVALRSAWIESCHARLFAGAGIVRESDPDAELTETRLKLGTMLSALMEL